MRVARLFAPRGNSILFSASIHILIEMQQFMSLHSWPDVGVTGYSTYNGICRFLTNDWTKF